MNEKLSPLSVLNAADEILRKVISRTEGVANKPAQEWTIVERKQAMEMLARAAEHAIDRLDEWSRQDIWIKGTGRIVSCLDSIRTMARISTFGPGSRIAGRTFLKSDAEELKRLLGDGCALDPEAITDGGGEQLPHNGSTSTQTTTPLINPNDQIYSIKDLMALHGLSRQTLIRIYEHEPGVQVLQASPAHQRKIGRRYRTIRVPKRVYLRVKNRMEVK